MTDYYDCSQPSDEGTGESSMVTQADVKKFVHGRPESYFVVYADWCGACHGLFQSLGVPFKKGSPAPNIFPNVQFAEIETVDKPLQKLLGVEFFPTVIKFENGQPQPDKQANRAALEEYVHSLAPGSGRSAGMSAASSPPAAMNEIKKFVKQLFLKLEDAHNEIDDLKAKLAEAYDEIDELNENQ